VLDGLELLALVRADPSTKDLPVIILSGLSGETNVRKAISLGVEDYILKPLDYEKTITRIQHAANGIRRAQREKSARSAQQLPKVLVADPDPNFCRFAGDALTGHYVCETVSTAAQVMVRVVHSRPQLVLLSPKLPGLDIGFLLVKLETVSGGSMPVYLISDSEDAGHLEHVKGVMAYTFVPEKFRVLVASALTGEAHPEEGPWSWLKSIEANTITAIRQAFGMMTGIEPNIVQQTMEGFQPELCGFLAIRSGPPAWTLRLSLEYNRGLAVSLAAAMTGMGESEIDEETQASGIKEVLNVIAGRIKLGFEERNLESQQDLPEIRSGSEEVPGKAEYSWSVGFQWNEKHSVRFQLGAFPEAEATPASETAVERG
jgi:CheY-like chemotaxis protein